MAPCLPSNNWELLHNSKALTQSVVKSVSSEALWDSVLINRPDGVVEVERSSLDLKLEREQNFLHWSSSWDSTFQCRRRRFDS